MNEAKVRNLVNSSMAVLELRISRLEEMAGIRESVLGGVGARLPPDTVGTADPNPGPSPEPALVESTTLDPIEEGEPSPEPQGAA